jgi:hypothetical protein
VIAEYDRDHRQEDPIDKRRRELAEAREAQERERQAQQARASQQRAEQQVAANNSKAWCDWVDQRIGAALANQMKFSRFQTDALGQVIAELRAHSRKEAKAAVEEAQRAPMRSLRPWSSASFSMSSCASLSIWSSDPNELTLLTKRSRQNAGIGKQRSKRSKLPSRRLSARSRQSWRHWSSASRRRRQVAAG